MLMLDVVMRFRRMYGWRSILGGVALLLALDAVQRLARNGEKWKKR